MKGYYLILNQFQWLVPVLLNKMFMPYNRVDKRYWFEAIKHGGSLSVELSRNDNSQEIKIAVSDTGVGIKKEDLIHIFDPYFTTKQSGTGLGLAIVHKIIESHKGEVRVESELGKGTTVKVLLPVSKV